MALGGSGGGGSGGIRAGAAFVELYTKDAKLRSGLKSATDQLRTFAAGMAATGMKLVGVGGAAAAGLGAIFAASTNRNTEFFRLSEKLGETTENLSAFAYAAETTGQTLDRILDNFENWPDRLVGAASGAGQAAESFRTLGLDAQELAKLPLTEQMVQLAGALQKVGNESQRLQILGNLFSDKGQGFNELFKKGPDGIRKLMAEAGSVGAVVTSDNAKASAEISATWAKAYAAVKYAVLSVGDALIPQAATIKMVGEQIATAAVRAREWAGENKELVVVLGASSVGLVGLGAALVAAAVPVRLLSNAILPLYSTLRAVATTALTPVVLGFSAVRTSAVALNAAVPSALQAVSASVSAAGTVVSASMGAVTTALRAAASAGFVLPSAFSAAQSVLAIVGGGLVTAYSAVRAAAVGVYSALTAANAKWLAQAAVVGVTRAAYAGFWGVVAAGQAAWQAVVQTALLAETAVMGVAAGMKAAWGAVGAAWGALKSLMAAGSAALVVGVEAVFASWLVFKSAVVVGSAALSTAWSAFAALYAATGAVIVALPAIFGAVWTAGSAIAGAAWAGLTAAFQAGAALMVAAVALVKAAILALPAAIIGLGVYWAAFSESGKRALTGFAGEVKSGFVAAFEDVKSAWGELGGALATGDLQTAMKIGLALVQLEWVRFSNWITEKWESITAFMSRTLDDAMKTTFGRIATEFGDLISTMADGLQSLFEPVGVQEGKAGGVGVALVALDPQKEAEKRRANAEIEAAKAGLNQILQQAADERAARAAKAGAVKGAPVPKPDNPILGGLTQSRATYGGSASLGFFAGAASPFKKLEDQAAKNNSLLDQINAGIRLMVQELEDQKMNKFGTVRMPNGDLVFVGGK